MPSIIGRREPRSVRTISSCKASTAARVRQVLLRSTATSMVESGGRPCFSPSTPPGPVARCSRQARTRRCAFDRGDLADRAQDCCRPRAGRAAARPAPLTPAGARGCRACTLHQRQLAPPVLAAPHHPHTSGSSNSSVPRVGRSRETSASRARRAAPRRISAVDCSQSSTISTPAWRPAKLRSTGVSSWPRSRQGTPRLHAAAELWAIAARRARRRCKARAGGAA